MKYHWVRGNRTQASPRISSNRFLSHFQRLANFWTDYPGLRSSDSLSLGYPLSGLQPFGSLAKAEKRANLPKIKPDQTKSREGERRVALGFFLHSAFCIFPSLSTFQPITACAGGGIRRGSGRWNGQTNTCSPFTRRVTVVCAQLIAYQLQSCSIVPDRRGGRSHDCRITARRASRQGGTPYPMTLDLGLWTQDFGPSRDDSIGFWGARPPRAQFGAPRTEHEGVRTHETVNSFRASCVSREARLTAPGAGALPISTESFRLIFQPLRAASTAA